jgi:hypothetical protein
MSKYNHDFSKIKSCIIRERKFKVIWRGHKTYVGACDSPDAAHKVIHISRHDKPLEVLLTTIEETLHGAFFDLDDEAVKEYHDDLRKLLMRMKIQVQFPQCQ